jgi:hypothetical protein
VLDSRTLKPIEDVQVILKDMSTLTDSKGEFSFIEIEPGYYTLTLVKEGYTSLADSGEIPQGLVELDSYAMQSTAPPWEPPYSYKEWHNYAVWNGGITKDFASPEELSAYIAAHLPQGDIGGRILGLRVPEPVSSGDGFCLDYFFYLSYFPGVKYFELGLLMGGGITASKYSRYLGQVPAIGAPTIVEGQVRGMGFPPAAAKDFWASSPKYCRVDLFSKANIPYNEGIVTGGDMLFLPFNLG